MSVVARNRIDFSEPGPGPENPIPALSGHCQLTIKLATQSSDLKL